MKRHAAHRSRRPRQSFSPLVVILAVALGVIALVRAAVGVAYADRIYPGVTVAGLDLGGMRVEEAAARLQGALAAYEKQPLSVRAGDKSFTLSPGKLGFKARPTELAKVGFEAGRGKGVGTWLLGPALARSVALSIAPSLLVDDLALGKAVADIAEQTDRPATNAELRVAADLMVTASLPGQAIDRNEAHERVLDELLGLQRHPIDLPVRTIAPTVTTAQLAPIKARVEALLDQPATLTDGQRQWTVPTDTIRSAVVVRYAPLAVDLNPEPFTGLVGSVAKEIDRPAKDAQLAIADAQVSIDPDLDGKVVDQAATLAEIREKLLAGESTVPLLIKTSDPAIRAADLQATAAQAQKQIDLGLALSAEGQTFTLPPKDLAALIRVQPDPAGRPALTLDEAKLKDRIAQINQRFRHPSQGARFGWSNGQVTVSGSTIPGVAINEDAAIKTVLDQWTSGKAALPVVATKIAVDGALLAQLNADLKGVIQTRETSFAGSIPERAHNITLSMSLINGSYVPPGAIFSFNRAVGPMTIDAGFQWGFGFTGGPNGSKVVPSVAGGICQVATTVFQPIFWAGYEIEERHWHMFPMASYRDKGYWGLDATVDEESGLDFQFRNGTDHGLLILASTTADRRARVTLIGTKPDWKVEVSPEQLTDYAQPPPGVIRDTSPLFEKGRTIILETAQQGFTSHVTRKVTYADGNVRTLKMTSKYLPSQESILVGSG